jgi:hypothetical protein
VSGWPWPGDSPLDRARRIAREYRDALNDTDPERCATMDARAEAVGQGWVRPRAAQYGLDDLLDIDRAADYCQVKAKTLFEWRRRGLEVVDTPDGPRYQVKHLLDYQRRRRMRRASRRR